MIFNIKTHYRYFEVYSICYTFVLVLFLYINCYTREVCMKSDVQLNLRAKESQRALIDAAAEILHKSRTDFILGDGLQGCGECDP
uniref:Uncharacterized protein n=1 Tax=Klebsiella pneumoniae TaxID=573 RepID=A0A8B0SPQ5_KLEPN|nr:hypothetical protein [Klebsiella pneumoniae]